MHFDLRDKYLSTPRYSRYLIATQLNKSKARELYAANISWAQAFHPLLSQFEVVLRNCLNTALISHFDDPDWIITQKKGFMKHHSLNHSHYFLKTCIEKTEAKLTRKGIPLTSGKIIADQTFGFWLAFFLPHHYLLINGQPIHMFPYKPSTENRASIHDKLQSIKNFRNRVNHCEPLCFVNSTINCTHSLDIRVKMLNLVKWIDPNLLAFFERLDKIKNKIDRIMRIHQIQ